MANKKLAVRYAIRAYAHSPIGTRGYVTGSTGSKFEFGDINEARMFYSSKEALVFLLDRSFEHGKHPEGRYNTSLHIVRLESTIPAWRQTDTVI